MSAKRATEEIAFDDLAELSDREIQMILREVDSKDMAFAMKGAGEKLKRRLFANMSERVGTLVREEMESFGSVPTRNVNEVQLRIMEMVKQLREAGQITWPRPAKRTLRRKPKLGREHLALKREVKNAAKRPLSELSLDEINRMFGGLAEVARREGILALDSVVQGTRNEFLATAVRLAVDGTEPELIQAILGTWMESLQHEHGVKHRKVLEGIMSIQSGDSPRIVEQKLGYLY